jgi:uncharacterized protein with PIN domain/sulfur carrier protein ThiS
MSRADFRFYAQLNDFLPLDRRQATFTHEFEGNPSVKDTIEALGIPHPEVDVIVVNGAMVDFSYQMRNGDRVSVYPLFMRIAVSDFGGLVQWPHTEEICFVLDIHLGRLAAYLRMLGYDSLYRNDYDDETLARISSTEQRVLLTRDVGLLKRSIVTYGYYVRSTRPRRQLAEVVKRFRLLDTITPFHRCLDCNGLLDPVRKEEILNRLPPRTQQYFEEFHICQDCDKIYWKGSHYDHMERLIADLHQSR